jgi:putative transposase
MYAIKLELKLNNKERSLLRGCAGFRRTIYNYGLDMVIGTWDNDIQASETKILDSAKKLLTNQVMKSDEYGWMKDYPSTIYQSAFQNLKDAFSRWRKKLTDFPVYATKRKGDSFTVYKTSGIYLEKGKPVLPFTNRQVLLPGKKIKLPGLGKFRLKEAIPFICSSQTFTISRQGDRWYVSFVIDAERIPPVIHEQEAVGIDLGVKTFATLSDGTTYDSPKPLKKARVKLAKIQWRNRRKQMGNRKQKIRASKNAKKYFEKQSLLHAKVANQRKDYLQKTTTEISRKYYRIRIEDLNVKGMIANHKLSAAISDLGFYEFRRMLEYKQFHYGTKVEIVDRWFPSSKQCMCCKTVNKTLKLSDRVFKCINPDCGLELDRDRHASLNLLHAPEGVVRQALP